MELKGKKLLTIVSKDFDDLEFFYPMIRLREAGAQVDIASEKAKEEIRGKAGLIAESDLAFSEVDISQYDGILIPGGWAPDYLRRFDEVLDFVRYLDDHDKLIAVICHAGWVLASAGILKGRTLTSTPGIKDDLIHAGATWVNEEAVADRNIISGRRPPDLPKYLPLIIAALQERS